MTPIRQAVLLAAGRGTRMRELTQSLPKPMILIRGKPVLLHIIEGLRSADVTRFLIVVGYQAQIVRDFFQNGRQLGVDISYITQEVQDGTGRVIDLAKTFVADQPFILHYGDIMLDSQNYRRLAEIADPLEALVSVKQNEDVSKGGAVFVNAAMEVTDVREKPAAAEPASPWYNAGVYTFRPSIFKWTAQLQPSPRGEYELTDAIRALALSGAKVQAIELRGHWADVRDPEILAKLNAAS